jgi:signal transduction histidine kinase
MATVFQDMRQMPIFSSFTDEQLSSLETQGSEISLQSGDVLFVEGAPAQGLYVIVEGELEIVKRIGGDAVVLANVGAGSFVGEISLLTGLPHTAMARATMPTNLIKYEVELFNDIKQSPIAQLLLVTMVTRLRDTESQVKQHEKLSALGKMAAGLAHELNNPASANLRAATELPETLATLQAQTLKLYNANLNGDQLTYLTELQSTLIDRAANASMLSPMAQSDLEDRIMMWCDAVGVDDSWQIAPMLAKAGVDDAELARIREAVGEARLGDTLSWLESALTIAGLSYTLKQSASRVSELVKAVKAYTYMDQTPLQDVDIHDGLESTLIVLQHKLNGINITRMYDRTVPKITAFGSELNQVWTILLDNAADALADLLKQAGRSNICVQTSHENGYLIVQIIDNGPGIPHEQQGRLFEPFFTTKPVGQGAGLGLSIARRIVVERHKGMIRAVSQPGETRFQVSLPVNS